MKKLLSMFMAIAIFLSVITIPVHAENEPTGSIVITNPTIGETYSVYQIFGAKLSYPAGSTVADGIAYSFEETTANKILYDAMFGTDGEGANYFDYNKTTKQITVKEGVQSAHVYNYLKSIIEKVIDKNLGNDAYQPIQGPVTATEYPGEGQTLQPGNLNSNGELVFADLPYGYYFVTSSLGSLVSINSTTPTATVIDKNQKPGKDFGKYIQTGEAPRLDVNGQLVTDGQGNVIMDPIWGKANTANISDKVNFKVEFEATNYDGTSKIEDYQIHDQKGEGLWVEFNSFEVFVGGEKLERGYYVPVGDPDALSVGREWEFFGTWTDEQKLDIDNAQWYLLHYGFDEFEILIPWLDDHDIELINKDVTVDGVTNKDRSYTITYPEDADFLYDSPSKVEVYYHAGVEYNASIGNGVTSKLFNTATATWSFGTTNGSTTTDRTETKVYGIGVTKVDWNDKNINLKGAKFEIYRKVENGKEPVFVIPTNIKGVYVVDSYNTFVGNNLTGYNRQPTRKVYEKYLADYLGADYLTTGAQKNIVESEVNGKFAILGLSEGTYILEEIEAPLGYNIMDGSHEITIDSTNSTSFSVYADKDGNVANISSPNELYSEVNYSLVTTVIENGKGTTLPSTGAEGTIKLITIGSFITIACGVLLITNKKMSVYKD